MSEPFFPASQVAAEEGAKRVKIVYTNVKVPILTCQDAIQAQSFYPKIDDVKVGDADAAIASAAHQVKGSLDIGGQMHFYMETQVRFFSTRSLVRLAYNAHLFTGGKVWSVDFKKHVFLLRSRCALQQRTV